MRKKLRTLQVEFAHLWEWINTAGLLIRVGGATERSFRKIELLEFEEEEENNAPIDFDYDNNYDNTDLFCEEDDDEDYDLCSGCDENPLGQLVQPCRRMICSNCVKKNNCQLCGLCELALSKDDRGHWEWVCYLGRSNWGSRGTDCWGINHASEAKRKRPTDWMVKFLIYRKLLIIWPDEWMVHGSFHLTVLSKIHYSNSFRKRKYHKFYIVSMVIQCEIVKLSLLCKTNWADLWFHFCFHFFRSVDLNKNTKRCLSALTLNLSFIWAWSLRIYLGLLGQFMCSNLCQEVGTQSRETVKIGVLRIFYVVIFLRLVYFVQYWPH